MNKLAEEIFRAKGCDVDVKTGLEPKELIANCARGGLTVEDISRRV